MRIGVLSDTHDRLPLIEKAVAVFNKANVELVIHLGDYIAPFSLNPLKRLTVNWVGVLGNNDGEIQGLLKASEGRIKPGPLSLELGGKRIIADHINPLRSSPAGSGDFDLILYGHTHELKIYLERGCLCVNPGEVCGYLTNRSTVVCLDLDRLATSSVDIIDLDR